MHHTTANATASRAPQRLAVARRTRAMSQTTYEELGKIARAGFEAGVYAAVACICGQAALKASHTLCDEMWRSGQR